MKSARMSGVVLLAVGLLASLAANGQAAPLLGNPNAYNDGVNPTWSGSTPFTTGTLSGHVEWAVFGPGQFPYANYSPTAGQLTYAYQVFITGAASLSSFSVALDNPNENNIGAFNDLGTNAPTASALTPAISADWTWIAPNQVETGESSWGLAFSSIRKPQSLFGTVVDHGQSSFVVPLPSPGPNPIPEPAAISVMALAGVSMLRRRSGAC